jgi:peptidoglycan/LPS O-acetylase OafA/YrhL
MTTVSKFLARGNNNLDAIRILCAIMVILFSLQKRGTSRYYNSVIPIHLFGAVAVKVFFFISGMLVCTSLIRSQSPLSFIIGRSFRISPAFIATVCICALLIGPIMTNLSLSQYFSDKIVLAYIYKNILMDIQYFLPGVFTDSIFKPAINGSLWTIPYEIGAYIALLSFFSITGMKNKNITNIMCIAIISSPLLSNGNDFITQTSNKDIYFLAPCFCLGVLYAVNSKETKINHWVPMCFFALFYIILNKDLSQLFFYFSVCSLFAFIASTESIKKLKIKNDISYGIYLCGFVVQQIVYSVKPDLNIYANISISIFITIIIATISFIMIERPAMDLSVSIRKRLINNK